jgi:hypothetical protein
MDALAELARTRRSLHGVGEGVIAGPQHREFGTIRLRATPGGFGGLRTPWRVDGLELTDGSKRLPLSATFGELAAAAGVEFGPPDGLYNDTSGCAPDDPIVVDPAAARRVAAAFELGDDALRAFAPQEQPVLWPEHFDLSVTADEVNYGVSPGDAAIPAPYAYIGPWQLPAGEFWNAAFGAARDLEELGSADAVAAFYAEGARLVRESRP